MFIVTSKLTPPSVPSFAVLRDQLVDQLTAALTRPLSLIVAPPGYGKSVLLGQLAARHPDRRIAWLRVDERDDDAHRFGRHLVAAIQRTDALFGETAGPCLQPSGIRLGDEFLDALCLELDTQPDLILALDDFSTLSNSALQEEIGWLAAHLPTQVHMVIAARSDPMLHRAKLVARGDVAELRESDLRMNEAEAAELLKRVSHRDLTATQVGALVQRTEGWPTGLQLAALSLRSRVDIDQFIADFSGDDRNVADYLTDEILTKQPPGVHDFLVRTSVVDRLTGPLCNALTGSDDGQRMLEHLDRSSLFLTRLDDRRESFRYHRLFRDLLRYELRATHPEDERELLRRAAGWLSRNGDTSEAVELYCEAEDWGAVLDIAQAHGRERFEEGEASTVIRWLASVPSEVIDQAPEAALTLVLLETLAGHSVTADVRLARLEQSGVLSPAHAAIADTVRALGVYAHRSPNEAAEAAERALRFLASADAADVPVLVGLTAPAQLRAACLAACGRALAFLGRYEDAWDHFRESLAVVVYPPINIVALGGLAFTEGEAGELDRAEALAQQAIRLARDASLEHHPGTAEAHLALALVRRLRGSLEEAELQLEEAERKARFNRRWTLSAVVRAERLRLELQRDRPDVTSGLTALTEATAEGQPEPPRHVEADLQAAEARLWLRAGRADRAQLILDRFDGASTLELAGASAALAAARQDVVALRKQLEDWPPDLEGTKASRTQHTIWEAVALDLEGARKASLAKLAEAVLEADAEGAVEWFLESGPQVQAMVRNLYHAEPTAFLRRLVDSQPRKAAVPEAAGELVEPLSDRELVVLRYLPSRLSNAEIASTLYVSVNTLKTHLKHVYRKLGVASRRDAINRAESLHLL